MLKQLVIVDPHGIRCDLYETAEGLGLSPCIVTQNDHLGMLPPDADVSICTELTPENLMALVQKRQVSGIWTPDPKYRSVVREIAEKMLFPHWAIPPYQSFLKTLKENPAVADLIHPEHFVSSVEEAEKAVNTLGIPVYIQSMQSGNYPKRMEVDNVSDVSLAFNKVKGSNDSSSVSVAKLPKSEVYWAPGFKIGREFKPIEIISVTLSNNMYRVPIRYLVPAELNGADYTNVVDVVRKVGLHLPHGVAAITMELIYTDNGPRVMSIRSAYDFEPVLKKLLNRGYGLEIDHDLLRIFAGHPPESTPCWEMASAAQWLQPSSGIVQSVQGIDAAQSVKGIREVGLSLEPGDTVSHIEDTEQRDRIGYILSQAASTETVLGAIQIASGCIHIETKPVLD